MIFDIYQPNICFDPWNTENIPQKYCQSQLSPKGQLLPKLYFIKNTPTPSILNAADSISPMLSIPAPARSWVASNCAELIFQSFCED